MDSTSGLHSCKHCNKQYSSYKSLWNHNKKFHINSVIPGNTNVIPGNTNVIPSILIKCKYCNRVFKNRQNKWKHENKTCKLKLNNDTIIKLEEENKKLKDQIKTVNKTTNNTNNGTIINNTTNIKVSFGDEDIQKLSKKDKKAILNSGYMSIIKLIDLMHLNKAYPEYQNIKIHNLKDKYAKIYDETNNNFTTVSKKDTIDSLICYRTINLKSIYKDYNKPDNELHQCVTKLVNKLESYTPDTDDVKILDFYKNLTEEIILMIYNKTKIFENST